MRSRYLAIITFHYIERALVDFERTLNCFGWLFRVSLSHAQHANYQHKLAPAIQLRYWHNSKYVRCCYVNRQASQLHTVYIQTHTQARGLTATPRKNVNWRAKTVFSPFSYGSAIVSRSVCSIRYEAHDDVYAHNILATIFLSSHGDLIEWMNLMKDDRNGNKRGLMCAAKKMRNEKYTSIVTKVFSFFFPFAPNACGTVVQW